MATILSDLDSGRRSFLGGLIASAVGSLIGLFALPEYAKFYTRHCVWKSGYVQCQSPVHQAINTALARARDPDNLPKGKKRGAMTVDVFETDIGFVVEVCETRRIG